MDASRRTWFALAIGALVPMLAGAASADPARRACRTVVIDVRRSDVYLSKPAGCALGAGEALRSESGQPGTLEVVAMSSKFVLARAPVAAGVSPGDSYLPVGEGERAAPGPAAATKPIKGYSAGPGARSVLLAEPFWRAAVAARSPLAPAAKAAGGQAASGLTYSGSLGVGVQTTLDGSQRQRDYWRAFADSTLRLRLFGPVGVGYSHRLIWQRRFAYQRTSQPWEGDYPEWGVRELRLDLYAISDRLLVSAGRLAARGVGGARVVDGGVVEGRLVPGLAIGAYGGLLPDPSSLAFSSSALGFGGFLRGEWTGAGTRLSGSLQAGGSTFDAKRDELYADGLLGLRFGRWLHLTAMSRLNFVGTFNPQARPAVDLTRLYAAASSLPLSWLEVGLRYSFYRWVPSRRTYAQWGEPLGLSDHALSALGVDTAFTPLPGLRLGVEADLDMGGPAGGPGVWGGLVASYSLADSAHRFEVSYRIHDTPALSAHHAQGSIRLGLLDRLELEVAYRFGRITYTGPSNVAFEHDVNLVLDWWIGWGLHAWLDASWLTGDDVEAGLILARFGWRFK